MNPTINNLHHFLLILGGFALTSVVFLGIPHFVGMDIQNDGTMSGCPLTTIEQICTMSLTDHISRWQSILASIPPKLNTLYLAVFAALLILAAKLIKKLFTWAVNYHAVRAKIYLSSHPDLPLFNPLQEIFSDGILNPKIY